jgi:hypothetical protein
LIVTTFDRNVLREKLEKCHSLRLEVQADQNEAPVRRDNLDGSLQDARSANALDDHLG